MEARIYYTAINEQSFERERFCRPNCNQISLNVSDECFSNYFQTFNYIICHLNNSYTDAKAVSTIDNFTKTNLDTSGINISKKVRTDFENSFFDTTRFDPQETRPN